MGYVCCVPGCLNSSVKGFRLFQVPEGARNKISSTIRRRRWLQLICKDEENTRHLRICQIHFRQDDFQILKGRKNLLPDAIPRLHLPRQSPIMNNFGTSDNYCNKNALSQSSFSPIPPGQSLISLNAKNFEKRSCEDNHHHHAQRILDLEKRIEILETEKQKLNLSLQSFLNKDQLQLLQKGIKNHKVKWSNETVLKSYKLRIACGTTGYEVLRELGQPLPSIRTLNKRMEHLKFCPGLLNEVFQMLQFKSELMKPEEKFCALLLDEMAITPKHEFDSSTGLVLGKPTLPNSRNKWDEHATHGLVYMLTGVSTRWKQIVGYQFTSNSFSADLVKEDILNIIREAEHIGLKVVCVLSDMSGQNQGIWKLFNIHAGKYSTLQNFCVHPCNPDRKLYFSPDPPHILKNLRDHLSNNQNITIPNDFVTKYNLPGNTVSMKHFEELLELDKRSELKIVPYLKENCITPSHFEKMRVGLALALFHHDTGAGIRYYVSRGKLGNEMLTTAWFCEQIFKWFKLMTSRTRSIALKDGTQYTKDIDFLKEIQNLFYGIKIGVRNVWKPVQTGVILATQNAIDLADHFLKKENFYYLCLGRFTQDAIENSFSVIRSIQPIPSAREFKTAIRLISISQYNRSNRKGNYEISDAEYLTNFLIKNPELSENDNESDDVEHLTLDFFHGINLDEHQSLYYLAGRTVNQVVKIYKLNCSSCINSIKTQKSDPQVAELVELTELKAYSKKITFASIWVFHLIKKAEEFFRQFESCLLKGETKLKLILNSFMSSLGNNYLENNLPKCHDVGMKLVVIYYKARVHFLTRESNTTAAKTMPQNQRCDSRSIGMRRAVKNIR